MTIVPLTFPQPSEAAVASYDWEQIADATGFVTFYGGAHSSSAEQSDTETFVYSLSRNAFFSKSIVTALTGISITSAYTDYTYLTQRTFSLSTFNLPATIKGTAEVKNSFVIRLFSAGTSVRVKVKYAIGKDGVEIASAFSQSLPTTTDTYGTPMNVSSSITIPITHFKVGEALTLRLEMWGKYASGDDKVTYVKVGCDPLNRDDPDGDITPSTEDEETTQLNVTIPFKIEL